jgi:energy-coupling factor transporter ATP-binding protein EcfA2
MNFCDDCWGKQGPHKLGRNGPDGLPHEKGDPTIVKRLKNILTPPTNTEEQQQLHVDDEDTTWFGIARDDANQPIFQDYGRYANIMSDTTSGVHTLRYPQLVSFIGQTGAGKSTLIKMLIDQQERRSRPHQTGHFASPVVGSVRTENVPTSGDVHLYVDPRTYLGEYPLLYADCEGLEGGENMPISAQYCNSALTSERKEKHQDQKRRRKRPKMSSGTPRKIRWASTPETSKRQYAVTELYPRLLYTFSDVIVFVLRNPKYDHVLLLIQYERLTY